MNNKIFGWKKYGGLDMVDINIIIDKIIKVKWVKYLCNTVVAN